MPNCELLPNATCLSTLHMGHDGNVEIRPVTIPPPPPRAARRVEVPPRLRRQIEAKLVRLISVMGDSMQPAVLHNDMLVVSLRRWPRDGEMVLVKASEPHRVWPGTRGILWRYHIKRGYAYLTKDNPKYPGRIAVTPHEIIGVATRLVPRTARDEQENYYPVQRELALCRGLKRRRPASDFGFYSQATAAAFRTIVDIPPSELIGDRLPWGLFRGVAREDHPHLRVSIGDRLTIKPTGEMREGAITIVRHRSGKTVVGTLQPLAHGRWPRPEFYIDLVDRQITLTRSWTTMGLLQHVERPPRRGSARGLGKLECPISAEAPNAR
jgi:hypothetical protein